MKRAWILLFAAIVLSPGDAPVDALRRAGALEEAGKFREAAGVLNAALQKSAGDEKRNLQFELDRLRRTRRDYSLTKDALWDELAQGVSNLSREEYDRWVALGWFDGRFIDDTLRFVGASLSNLFFRHQDLESRRRPQKDETATEAHTWSVVDSISRVAAKTKVPYVLPKRFRMTMKLTVNADAVPEGATIRAWLPVPRRYPYQIGFRAIASSSPVKALAPEDSPIRSVYMEQKAKKGIRTVFSFQYKYSTYGVRFDLDPARTEPFGPGDSSLAQFTREGPHVVFTERISSPPSGRRSPPAASCCATASPTRPKPIKVLAAACRPSVWTTSTASSPARSLRRSP